MDTQEHIPMQQIPLVEVTQQTGFKEAQSMYLLRDS